MGYCLSSTEYYTEKEISLRLEAIDLIKEKGTTNILSKQLLTEEVLPDNTSKDVVLDTLRYKLNRINPQISLIIIDPYLFPKNNDADYESYFFDLFRDVLSICKELHIITRKDRNKPLELKIKTKITSDNPQISIDSKYTEIFHDRFWIADEARGLFVGTSLNGVGKRYAIVDYLDDRDTNEIVKRFKSIS
jgi:hypothetical protein